MRDLSAILIVKNQQDLYGTKLLDGKLCHPAYKSHRIFKLSNRSKIAQLNVISKFSAPTIAFLAF